MAATVAETQTAGPSEGQAVRQVAITDANGNTVIKEEPIPEPTDFQILIKLVASVRRIFTLYDAPFRICSQLSISLDMKESVGSWNLAPLLILRNGKSEIAFRIDGSTASASNVKCARMGVNSCVRSGRSVGKMSMAVGQVTIRPSPKGYEFLFSDLFSPEYTLVDSQYLLPIPEDVTPSEAAPILCAGTTVYRALKTANLSAGQWVAIVGAGGGLGHLAIQYAKALGLKVLAIDGGLEKISLCTRLGADAVIDFMKTENITTEANQITDGGAHGVLVTSSSARAYEQALTYVRRTGVFVCIGITPQKMNFPIGPEYFVAKGVRLTGTSTGTIADTKEALEFLRLGKVKPLVIDKKLEDIPGCIEHLEQGDAVGKFVITF